jgi:molecular chaperone DnaK (HSP70)
MFRRPARNGLDPDEVVATGAAVEGSTPEAEHADMLVPRA